MKRKLTLRKSAVIAALAVAGALLASVGCKNGVDDEPAPIAVESVTLSSSSLTFEPGEWYNLNVNITPSNADDKTVTWSSSDTAVATVAYNGLVCAIKRGTATITARVGDKSATCLVTVKTVAVQSVTLDKSELTLEIGKTGELRATVMPDNADDKTVTWSESDTSIVALATAGNNCTFTAYKEGTATITAQAGGKEARCQVIVKSQNNTTSDSGNAQGGTTHVHNYSGGLCTVCGFQKPFMVDATIDDSGVLTNYRGSESMVDIPNGVTGIGSNAFEGCESLVVVKIPSSVTAIGSCAFKGCKNLYDIRMSKGVTKIGSYAFQDCIGLTSVTIPASVKNIGRSAFQGCRELGKVSMSKGVECIESYAFYSCTSLYSVYIPSSVTDINKDAFGSCDKLTSVQYDGTETEWNRIGYSSLKGKKIIGKDKNGDVTTWTSAY